MSGYADLSPDRCDPVPLSTIVTMPVRWIWPSRLPLGKVTVLDGDPGPGKSTLALLDGPASVLFLSAEDSAADTLRLETLENWYRAFLDDMDDCAFVRGSTFYRLGLSAGGRTPPRYMSVHELRPPDGSSPEQTHAAIMGWMWGAKLHADLAAVIQPNEPVALEFWGYYDHIATRIKASEEDLLGPA
ncbi:MAG: hypothetical protein ACKVVT_04650 [Dehalococcoidia bacterium]